MTSQLTKLAQERSTLDLQILGRKSQLWLQDKIKNLRNINSIASSIAREQFRHTTKFKLGKLYFFYYDPKGKAELPYYDVFPLVLILEKYNDGFLGLNFHYLPLRYRMAFLDKLTDYAVYDKNDEISRLRVTYDILNASRRYREFQPCLKRYLFSHVKSHILDIQPNEWEVASHLPIHQFKKAQPKEIWQESLDQIKKSQ
jgi:hypothetical protein